MIQITKLDKPKNQQKYKHKDEDAWIADHPGEEFEPFDPERAMPYHPEKGENNRKF